ncbi:MAG: trypsin-like peptidase domain-containing protein [Oscillospiraceae bacterium]|nr:trypsin-like peptidase domain-containing protein [Oscillospiraceae bacterium]
MENYQQDQPASSVQDSPFANSPFETGAVHHTPAVKVPKKSGKKGLKTFFVIVIVLALMLASAAGTAAYINDQWEEKTRSLQEEMSANLSSLQLQLEQMKQNIGTKDPDVSADTTGLLLPSQVYAKNVDAVVAISNHSMTTNIFGQVSRTASSGSGFIISKDGYVVSNYHVIQGANKLTVLLASGKEYDAQVIGFDASNDIAVLKIEGTDFPCVKLGSSNALVVGDRVAAIGNPLGELTSTMTVGYISAKDRNVNTDGTSMNMLQTDAAINSGNSGGPLFNMYGEVVGITTAKYSGTSNSGATIEGIGFAIPIDDVADMFQSIIDNGYVSSAYLGVVVEDVSADDARKYGLPMGALITEISPGYAAERAGLEAYDIIIELGDQKVTSVNDLTKALRRLNPKETTQIKVSRSGKELTLQITLDEKPQQIQSDVPQQTQPGNSTPQSPFGGMEDFFWPFFG